MTTDIARISQIAKERPKEIFTSVYHMINTELLKECYDELDGNKAKGIDGITKREYGNKLKENLENIVQRLKNKCYKPSPARRVRIPKANGKMRGLAIANFEDKIVQLAISKIIGAIFEPKLASNMFGFRPNRNCHDCLRYLKTCIEKKKTNYILDADIHAYFDNINHNRIIECLEMHLRDKNLLRLIRRFLKAGIIEAGKYTKGENGTQQGSILSPILANIYMYYVLIKWFDIKIKPEARGYMEIVNYADDLVICFQWKEEAEEIYEKIKTRLNQCQLEFSEEKTRLIEFGRFAKHIGKNKADTFDFLGFTHYCSTRRNGSFRVKLKTARKKFKQKMQEYKVWIKRNRNKPLHEIMETTIRKLTGHNNYYGVTDNIKELYKFRNEIVKLLRKWLNRRSQKKSYTQEGFKQMLERYKIPTPKIKVELLAM